MSLAIREVLNPAAPRPVSNQVTSLIATGSVLSEMPLATAIHEFLFEVTKDGTVFWVGAAVPLGTTDFTRTQMYFHPMVVQPDGVHARDEDYRGFTGGWSGTMQRYVAMEGGQLAGARLMPLLVPFTTMGALSNPALNMFSHDPVDTLNAIMAEIQNRVIPVLGAPSLSQVGVSSFSSGLTALKLFLSAVSSSGLVKEVIDFDSPFIVGNPRTLLPSPPLPPGAVAKCYSQMAPSSPQAGYVHIPTASFAGISSYPSARPDSHAHACIGFMTYWPAMLTSVIL
jgi:hypothetical protein